MLKASREVDELPECSLEADEHTSSLLKSGGVEWVVRVSAVQEPRF